MPGQPNYTIWSHYVVRTEPALFLRGRIHHLGHFPMLSEGGDDVVHGFLVEIGVDVYADCLNDLDYLENYRPGEPEASLYQRAERWVQLADDKMALAWVYIGNPIVADRYPVIASGDWRQVWQHSTNTW